MSSYMTEQCVAMFYSNKYLYDGILRNNRIYPLTRSPSQNKSTEKAL